MGNFSLINFLKIVAYIVVFNTVFTLALFGWVKDSDFHGLPKATLDRFVSLFYFGIASFTTTGYGDIYAVSMRLKLLMAFYMVIAMSLSVSYLVTI